MEKVRILIVDDNEGVRMAVGRTVKTVLSGKTACELFGAAKQLDAIKIAFQEFPEVIITDLNLSRAKMNEGLEFIDQLLARRIVFEWILISGELDELSRTRAAELGAVAVLEKPFTLDEFEQALGEALSRIGD